MAELLTLESLVALLTLAALEIVLGIDNIVFIAIVTGRLEPRVQPRARRLGLLAAMCARIALLFCITWIMRLDKDLFAVLGQGISGKDLILAAGGLFLLAKATYEIHHKLEVPRESHQKARPAAASFTAAIGQIMMIDVIFSLDSVITAVGMTEGMGSDGVRLTIMITAIVVAVGVMLAFAEPVSAFIERHPTMKMLALAFLLLIGVMLVAEAFDQHVKRGYIYFAMAFSLGVEMLNIRARKAARVTAGK
ncbi:MAG: TerC family protein [Planctomycetes bacterium]|nr:TerC family protein [Planctomycetota bacterium]